MGAPKPALNTRFLLGRVLPVYPRAGHLGRAVLTANGAEWKAGLGILRRRAGLGA
ncbi:MAG: hypothetical protein ACRDIC_01830 [bacterium]